MQMRMRFDEGYNAYYAKMLKHKESWGSYHLPSAGSSTDLVVVCFWIPIYLNEVMEDVTSIGFFIAWLPYVGAKMIGALVGRATSPKPY